MTPLDLVRVWGEDLSAFSPTLAFFFNPLVEALENNIEHKVMIMLPWDISWSVERASQDISRAIHNAAHGYPE